MIKREISRELRVAAKEYPVVTILGPRQAGKTTLARMAFPDLPYYSLENPDQRIAVETDPRGFLRELTGGAILDEVQRLPQLLSHIQQVVDDSSEDSCFILTGSHQPELHAAISQSLAGRTAMLSLWPFSLDELADYKKDLRPFDLCVKGFFPRLHQNNLDPRRFYNGYLQTYVERDLRALIQIRNLSQFQKFLILLAGRIGQLLNIGSLANDVGVSTPTINKWLSVLKASFIIFDLQPYFANVSKRLVKSPKIYFTDVGLAAFLLGIHTEPQALRDPLRGNLYENLVIAEIIKSALNKGIRPELYFYRDSNGNEVDVLIREAGMLYPVEIKSSSTFSRSFTKGLTYLSKIALGKIHPGCILYNGNEEYRLSGVSVFNPLAKKNLWALLTLSEPAD